MLEQPAFGQRLRSLRTRRGLSQTHLAGDGMSTGYLSRLESGARPPTARAVRYLAGRLGVDPVTFDEERPRALSQVLASVTSAGTGTDPEAAVGPLIEALGHDGRHDAALLWQALWVITDALSRSGRPARALPYAHRLRAAGDGARSPELQVRSRVQLARCLRIQGDNAEARACAAEAVAMADGNGLGTVDRAAALLALVSAEAEAGALPEAVRHADELTALVEHHPGRLRAEALWVGATVRVRQGDHEGARSRIEAAMADADPRADVQFWLRLRIAAASLLLQIAAPDTAAARRCLTEAQPALALVGTPKHQQEFALIQAQLAFHEGRHDEARELCARLEAEPERLSFRDTVRLEGLRGRLLIMAGDAEAGIGRLRDLARRAGEASHLHLSLEMWRTLAEQLAHTHGAPPPETPPPGAASGAAD